MELTPADWLQFGVAGAVIVSIIVGWLTPGRQTEREQARADRLEEEVLRLMKHNEERVIPLLVRAMELLEEERRRAVPP